MEDNTIKRSTSPGSSAEAVSEFDPIDNSSIFVKIYIDSDLIYYGQVLNEKRNGRGFIKSKSGQVLFDGQFKDDLFHGYGILNYSNGDCYSGNFEFGSRSGNGTYIMKDEKCKFIGNWLLDKKSGFGDESFPDGSIYSGNYYNNKKNGKGIYI